MRLTLDSILYGGCTIVATSVVVSVTGSIAILEMAKPKVRNLRSGAMASYLSVRRYVVAVGAIGPYATGKQQNVVDYLQKVLIDVTREKLNGDDWFPTNAIRDVEPQRFTENGHSVCGAVRDEARRTIQTAIDQVGLRRYEISPGGHSQDEKGVVVHYAPADLHKRLRVDLVEEDSVIVMIDTDYYVSDMDLLLGYGRPMIMHTFVPQTVAGVDGDTPFKIEDDRVVYGVSGGGVWKHKIWDWCAAGEFVESKYRARTLMGWLLLKVLDWMGFEKVVYQKVYHCRPWNKCPNRVLVWTAPEVSCWHVHWLPNDIHARKLKRMSFESKERPGWNKLESIRNGGEPWVSCGRIGEEAHFEILKADLELLMGLQTTQSVSSRMIGLKYTDNRLMALMAQYYRGADKAVYDQDRVVAPCDALRPYYPAVAEADELEVNYRAVASPVVHDFNCVPMLKRWDVMMDSIDKRVEMYRNPVVPPKDIQNMAAEYIRLVVPDELAGSVVPYSDSDTINLLSKPSQQLAIKQVLETLHMDPKFKISSFMKNEPVMKSGRLICAFEDARYLVQYSKFTLAIRDQMLHREHNAHWFIPGSTPASVADKVMDYCASVHWPIESDYTNLDGTVSEWLQLYIGQAVYNRAVDSRYRHELTKLQDYELRAPAEAKRFGFRYDAGVGVKSGSPTTCDKNTIYNGFVMYCAVRKTRLNLTPKQAFGLIGMCFGDDALFDQQFGKQLNVVTAKLGLKIKVEKYEEGKGLCFLARVFPDPFLTNTSFQDPLRTWRKLHLTGRDKNIPIATAATDRLEGYLVTDPLSPVTSDYAKVVVKLYAEEVARDVKREKRLSRHSEKPYWLFGSMTNSNSWPQREDDVGLMWEVTAARTGIDVHILRDYCAKIATVTNVWALSWMERTDEPYPYVDHLDADGYVGGSEAELDLVNEKRDVNRRRFCENSAKGHQDHHQQRRNGVANTNGCQASRESAGHRGKSPRYPSVHEHAAGNQRQAASGNRQFSGEAATANGAVEQPNSQPGAPLPSGADFTRIAAGGRRGGGRGRGNRGRRGASNPRGRGSSNK